MIRDLLPTCVAVAEAFGDLPGVTLFAVEEAAIARAVPRRRSEFTTVRSCARTALAHLGLPPTPLVPGRRGAPQWPAGVVGSMTHCTGYRAAAVAPSSQVAALGIDAEPDEPLPPGVLGTIARAEELDRLHRLTEGTAPGCSAHWERLLFTCKESVFKTWYPITGRELGFEEASITIDAAHRTFTADLLVDTWSPLLPQRLHGRWIMRDGLVLSAISVPAPPAP